MSKPQTQRPKPPPSGRTNLASCIVATIFLIFIVIVSLIVYFTVFKPKDPKISVSAVQLPSFSILNSTVNFTFSQYVAVSNPNRAAFRHYDSTLQLLYSGNQVGFMFIPAGVIRPGQTQFMAATFAVNSFPVSDPNLSGAVQGPIGSPEFGDGLSGYRGGGPTMEIESRLQMAGRVRVMHVFTHHAEANSGCRVDIARELLGGIRTSKHQDKSDEISKRNILVLAVFFYLKLHLRPTTTTPSPLSTTYSSSSP